MPSHNTGKPHKQALCGTQLGIISYLALCGDQLLVSYLRRSNQDQAKHARAILALLVKRFRQQWPGVKIVFRGDSGFCRHPLMTWYKRHQLGRPPRQRSEMTGYIIPGEHFGMAGVRASHPKSSTSGPR